MPMTVLTIQEVNNIISEHFIKIFGSVVDNGTAAAIGILKSRPFKNAADISAALNAYLDSININDKHKILMQYPDVISKLADLSNLILLDRRIFGLETLTIVDKRRLSDLNRKYTDKFGFSFVVHLKDNKIWNIFSALEARVENTREEEVQVAIEEVKKIGKFRIDEILQC